MEHKLGAIFSPKDVRDYHLVASAMAASYPDSYAIENMPPVKNQGRVGSCVAHAISTVIEYHSRKYGDNNAEMSVGYIYGNRRNTTHTGEGMITRDAIANTCKYGDVTKDMFPLNSEVPEIIKKFEEDLEELYDYGRPQRFSSYFRINNDNEAKETLMKNNPIVMAMDWYDDVKAVNGILTTSMEKKTGGHCMVIYGWNEQGWLVQNSWGTSWGNKGNVIIPYDIPIKEKFGIIDEISEQKRLNEIKELEEENKRARNLVIELEDTVTGLLDQLNNLRDQVSKLQQENEWLLEDSQQLAENAILIEKLNDNIRSLSLSLGEALLAADNYEKTIAEKEKRIAELENEILELQKPFQSKGGKFIAKYLNLIIKAVDWIFSKFGK